MSDQDDAIVTKIVPKFSSFKSSSAGHNLVTPDQKAPKFASFKHSASSPAPARPESKPKDRHHRPKVRDSDTQRRHGKQQDARGEPDNKRRRLHDSSQDSGSRSLEAQKAHKQDIFQLDNRGDRLITQYGGINKADLLSYHRYGRGRVLGTEGRLLIHRDGPRDQFSLVMPGEGHWISKHTSGLQAKISWNKRASRRVKASTAADREDDVEPFLALGTSRQTVLAMSEEVSKISDHEQEPDYRSIEGKAKTKPDQGWDESSNADSEAEDEKKRDDDSDPLKQKSVRLQKLVKDHPQNIDGWLELVDHQDALLYVTEHTSDRPSDDVVHSFREIKVSLLESALTNVAMPADRQRVLRRLLTEGARIWSTKKTIRKWEEFEADKDGSFCLWREYLNFAMTNIKDMHYEKISALLSTRIRRLLARAQTSQGKDQVEVYGEVLYLFTRATRFMSDAGYQELAIALWQALIEVNLFRPDSPNDTLVLFRDFWESEVPRAGEEGARGWRHFVAHDAAAEVPDPRTADSSKPDSSSDPFKAWGFLETFKTTQAVLPARTMDEDDDQDPFRVVMYTDVEPWLFIIPKDVIAVVRKQLIDFFLLFCGLAPSRFEDKQLRLAVDDPFLLKWSTELPLRNDSDTFGAASTEDRMPRKVGILRVEATPALLHASNGPAAWLPHEIGALSLRQKDSVRHLLGQLVHDASVPELRTYYLAFASWSLPGHTKKIAKALLKQFPEDMALYQEYALCEARLGNLDVAGKVIKGATSMLKPGDQTAGLHLWLAWAQMDLHAGNMPLAASRLCSAVGEKDPQIKVSDGQCYLQSAVTLRVQQDYMARFHDAMFQEDYGSAAIAAQSLVLFDYLTTSGSAEPRSTTQGNIAAAMERLNRFSIEFQAKKQTTSTSHEALLQFAAMLLHTHASKGPYRRQFLKDQSHHCVTLFPHNTLFLALFEWADSSLRIVDETRSMLHDEILVPGKDCLSSRVFSIQHEMHQGSIHSTKKAFELAVASDACRSSIRLWLWYLDFCLAEKELRGGAKQVFYRALKECPWSKETMMKAFVQLGKYMDSAELRSVYETMESKGLRIHVELAPFLEKKKKERETVMRKEKAGRSIQSGREYL